MERIRTNAIEEAKCASMHLYSDDCFTHENCTTGLGRRVNKNIQKKVIQDLSDKGIDASFLIGDCSISDLYKGIEQVKPGNRIGDISNAIEEYANGTIGVEDGGYNFGDGEITCCDYINWTEDYCECTEEDVEDENEIWNSDDEEEDEDE